MTWTYDPSIPTDKDAVRFEIGDTDTNDQLLQDEEIGYLLTTEGTVLGAAIVAAEKAAAKLAKQADQTVSKVSVSLSQRAEAYRKLVGDLKNRLAIKFGAPYAGGISKSDKEAEELDEDRVQPNFTIGMDDFDKEIDRDDDCCR